jgi:cytoskeletal protein RodZ
MAVVLLAVLAIVIISVGAWWMVRTQSEINEEIRKEYRLALAAMSDEVKRVSERESQAGNRAAEMVMRANEQTEYQTRALADTIRSTVEATVEAVTVSLPTTQRGAVEQPPEDQKWSMTDGIPEQAADWTADLIPDMPWEADRTSVPVIRPGESPIPGVSFPDLTGEGL